MTPLGCWQRMQKTLRMRVHGSLSSRARYLSHPTPSCPPFDEIAQSVSQTLHTCTLAIFGPLLSCYIDSVDPKATYTLLRRSLTALLHHVKNADQFSGLTELCMERSTATIKAGDEERTRRMLNIMSVLIGVRQGARLTGNFFLQWHVVCLTNKPL